MWIGNSFFYYKNGMPAMLHGMADAAQQPAVRGAMITMGGSGFDWHDAVSFFRVDAVGRYSFVGDNVIQFNPQGRLYDSAVMIDCSQCQLHPQLRESFWTTGWQHAAPARAIAAHPILIERPVVGSPKGTALCRPQEKVGALI